ncbi:L-rhamnose operon regulatory protein RhaS [Hartmannibacter diazotrophicus]|uniref:L-rhamnose operon regulatory protein RhaS n=1 Tax=Hartmannibacter diazotrophicus TaxID=1482074 RepID=A0A2C9D801_9HYPH|nr:AraC family transcriptional regulator [Hartmannibacter diazotrophicus]SON56258.1 L-rhamnose operon regulatory protein RhaS [Hartmannibacter diazotrophicus]
MGEKDRARFFRAERHDALEGLTAAFRKHRYEPHSHDTYVVGIIVDGCEAYTLRGERHYAAAGNLCFVNPGEVHDGEPAGHVFAYRITYPSVALLRSIAAEITGREPAGAPYFPKATASDDEAAMLFLRCHLQLETAPSTLAADEALVSVYALLLRRHAILDHVPAALAAHGRAVTKVMEFLQSSIDRDPDLASIADVAGLSRHHLIRLFKRETGLTPHAFLMDCRVRAARTLLARGDAPADVALACGFFDQSHLNRCFKARVGVAPGAFRRA